MPVCSQCAANNAADARFCNQCGSPLQAEAESRRAYTPRHLADKVLRHRSAMEGERKQVTVFFADMAGSTRLADTLDPEHWHRILDEFFSILGEEIHRFEGTINQYTGDGIMALFGAPIAHEDHARRAALAALALQERLRSFSNRLRLQDQINLSTRMGMNSGEVVVGSIGDDLRMDYTAKGLTVNLAARMEQIAEPGRIYLTRYTADQIADYVQLAPLGPMPVKGRDEPIEVFELRGQSAVGLRLEASRARGLTSFVGREQEMAYLQACADKARQGESQLLVMTADAGQGKSRLCWEARQRWEQQGLRVLACSGVSFGQALPLQPVKDLLRQKFQIAADDSPAAARNKLAGALLMLDPEMREELPLIFDFLDIADPDGPPLNVPEDTRERRLLELYRRTCSLHSGQAPILLIEDLHWLDEGSLKFLQAMVECSQASAALIIFNTRPGPLPAWLVACQPQMMNLRPLDAPALTQMTRFLLGNEAGLAELGKRIIAQARGNPFFLEEIVRHLAAHAYLQGEPGAYRLAESPDSIELPDSVQAVIAARVDRLDDANKALLQIAAVLGPQLSRGLLSEVSQLDGAALEQGLRELELGHYLIPDEGGDDDRLIFAHPLVQEVVYASLLRDKRRALHQTVGECLRRQARQAPEDPELLVQLARHWSQAADPIEGARWSLAAAHTMARFDFAEEVRLFRQTIALLSPLPDHPDAAGMAISARGGILRMAAFFPIEPELVQRCFEEGMALSEQRGDVAGRAELLISNGVRLLTKVDADAAVRSTGQAMRLVQEGGHADLEIRFRVPILFSYFAAGRLRDGLAVLDRRDSGAWHRGAVNSDNVMSRGFRGLMIAMLGEMGEAVTEMQRAIEFAEANDHTASWLYSNLVDTRLMAGEVSGCVELAEKALRQADPGGSPLFRAMASRAQGQVMLAEGKPEAALAQLQDTLPLVAADSIGRQFRPAHLMLMASARARLGLHEAALEGLSEAIEVAAQGHLRIWELRARLRRAELLLDMERPAQAEFDPIGDLMAVTDARWFMGDLHQLRMRQAEQAGDEVTAQEQRERAVTHWRRCGAPARVRGLQAATA